MFETSPTIGALATSLAAAQADIEGAEKDRKNDHFRSKYATLAAVWEAWQRVGPKHGLSVTQWPGAFAEGKVPVTTVLLHKSGEWMRETLVIPVVKSDPQGYGSAVTYARRYSLMALAGIAPEDDDGNAASQPKARHPDPAKMNPAKDEPGGEDDKRAKWISWVDEHKAKLRQMETAGDGDAVRAWKFKYDSALKRLMAADSELYEDLFSVFDDVATSLRPNLTAAG